MCKEYKVDVLVLGEHENIDENLTRSRFADSDINYKFEYIDKKSKVMVIRRADIKCSIIRDGFRYSVYKIKLQNNFSILLFAVHFPCRSYRTASELATLSTRIISEIKSIEKETEISNSLVVGDFNMNPFSAGMIDVYGFNSVMCKNTALKESRVIDGEIIRYYYNPMWHLMGNKDNDILGSYYHHKNACSYVWNTFDQVILRPNLISLFEEDKLQIITSFSNHLLIDSHGRPNKKRYSDHMPLMFEIREEN